MYFVTLLITILIILTMPAPAGADPAILVPEPGAKLSGMVRLSAEYPDPTVGGPVQFLLNGRPIGDRVYGPPYETDWMSRSVWDGPGILEAAILDDAGRVTVRSPQVPVTISNGAAVVRLISPQPNTTVSGTIEFAVEAAHPDGLEGWMFFVDGRLYPAFGRGPSNGVQIDTTEFENGEHHFFVAIYSNGPDHPPIGMTYSRVMIDNGRTLRGIRPRWSDIVLRPGASDDIGTRIVYTDASFEPLASGAAYESDNPAVAQVSESGTVRGIAPGGALITVKWQQKTATVRVLVSTLNGLPHFARDGQLLDTYNPARSLWLRTMFSLNADELISSPALGGAVIEAAINALTTGFYVSPISSGRPNLESWKEGYDDWWKRTEDLAAMYDLALLLTGDDVARNSRDLGDALLNPWSAEALRHALKKMVASKRAVAIEMIDEVTFLWGDTPKPNDGRWLFNEPPLPDNAFEQLHKILDSVPGRPPITWPVGGLSGYDEACNWMGDLTISDYATNLWTFLDWRRAYPDYPSLPQYLMNLDGVVNARMHCLASDRPLLLQVSATGPFYQKLVPGNQYQPGFDRLQSQWTPAEAVSAQIFYAVARGAAGVRVYTLDAASTKYARAQRPVGEGDMETGTDPFESGTDRWEAMGNSFRLLQYIEPFLFGARTNAVDLGDGIVTGARKGPRGNLLVAVNFNERETPVHADMTPYLTAGYAVRCLVASWSIACEYIPADRIIDEVTLAPGASAVWLFEPAMSQSSVQQMPAKFRTRKRPR